MKSRDSIGCTQTFNSIVLPSVANAVSIWEYTVAYFPPFILAGCMLKTRLL